MHLVAKIPNDPVIYQYLLSPCSSVDVIHVTHVACLLMIKQEFNRKFMNAKLMVLR